MIESMRHARIAFGPACECQRILDGSYGAASHAEVDSGLHGAIRHVHLHARAQHHAFPFARPRQAFEMILGIHDQGHSLPCPDQACKQVQVCGLNRRVGDDEIVEPLLGQEGGLFHGEGHDAPERIAARLEDPPEECDASDRFRMDPDRLPRPPLRRGDESNVPVELLEVHKGEGKSLAPEDLPVAFVFLQVIPPHAESSQSRVFIVWIRRESFFGMTTVPRG